MLHEVKDRQKFVSDVQCLQDMQHKGDSEYQACLRRQEFRRDSKDEKKPDQFEGQEIDFERSRNSSGSSSKQSSGEDDSVAESRASSKICGVKCESKLPAIDQTSVKQKHKSTMTPRKPEKSSETTKSPSDPVVQQETLIWAGETKLKRPTRERRNFVSSSPLMMTAENTLERARKGDPSALSQNEPHSTPTQTFQGMKSSQVLSEPLGPPLMPAIMGGPRRSPFRFRDEDFYSVISLNAGREEEDTEEEVRVEEELLLVGMRSPRSPSNHKRSRFLGTSVTQTKNKNSEENPEHCRGNSLRRSEPSHGSLRISNAMEPWPTRQFSLGQRMFQEPKLPDGESVKGRDSGGSENEQKPFHSVDTNSEPRQDGGLNAENVPSDGISVENRSGIHDYERDWQDYLNSSRNSFDHLLSARPTASRSSMNSSYYTPGSLTHFALRDEVPIDLSLSPTLGHSSSSEGNSRFNVRRPLSPIRNRNPLASAENHPVNSGHEFDVRGAEDITFTSLPQGAPLYTEVLFTNPQGSLSPAHPPSSSPSRRNVQGHLHVPGSLQENIPFTFFAVSDFSNQNDNGRSMAVSRFPDVKEATEIKTDPEKLKKLQESLLEEDSEEEGDLCRICQIAGGSPANPLLEPCGCVGSLRFVHQECLKKWLKVKITSGADLGAVKTCEMCKQGLLINLDDLNLTEFYQKHQQSRAQNELMNSGLYLVLLLHLYEQRFAELMRLNYSRVSRERIPSWEMEMKAFIQAGSSSKEAGRGAQQRPLHSTAPSVPPHVSFPPPPY
ncbi:putative E3 ubiquitin-protein ligase MARCHF10 isoform X4 [Ictidomys tridecemlineatus]